VFAEPSEGLSFEVFFGLAFRCGTVSCLVFYIFVYVFVVFTL